MTSSGPRASTLTREAHAKINAFLRVERRRPDGYHQIRSLILPITLADTIRVEASDTLKVEVTGTDGLGGTGADLPAGMNLALVGALALAEACDSVEGALIRITKRIPVAAGLGGGSADAAATLRVLTQLWGCGVQDARLRRIAAAIGSDVPALMEEGAVIVSGRGEVVEPVALPAFHWALLGFDFQTRSPDAYRWWDEDGSLSGPEAGPLPDAVKAGDPEALSPFLSNDLQAPVARRHPEVGEALEAFAAAGALGSVMSGSGPTVVALAGDATHAEGVADKVAGAVPVSSLGTS